MDRFIDRFPKELIDSRLASKRVVSGCTQTEVENLEQHFDIELPKNYKDFLSRMGKGAGYLFRGADVFYQRLFQNREAMEEVLQLDKRPFPLPKETFAFYSHQGYIFFFFDTSQRLGDLPVYGYRERELKAKLADDSFTKFLTSALKDEIEAKAKPRSRS